MTLRRLVQLLYIHKVVKDGLVSDSVFVKYKNTTLQVKVLQSTMTQLYITKQTGLLTEPYY